MPLSGNGPVSRHYDAESGYLHLSSGTASSLLWGLLVLVKRTLNFIKCLFCLLKLPVPFCIFLGGGSIFIFWTNSVVLGSIPFEFSFFKQSWEDVTTGMHTDFTTVRDKHLFSIFGVVVETRFHVAWNGPKLNSNGPFWTSDLCLYFLSARITGKHVSSRKANVLFSHKIFLKQGLMYPRLAWTLIGLLPSPEYWDYRAVYHMDSLYSLGLEPRGSCKQGPMEPHHLVVFKLLK